MKKRIELRGDQKILKSEEEAEKKLVETQEASNINEEEFMEVKKEESVAEEERIEKKANDIELTEMSKDIDREFEEFVLKNYKRLSEHEKKICEKMGICLPK